MIARFQAMRSRAQALTIRKDATRLCATTATRRRDIHLRSVMASATVAAGVPIARPQTP